MPVLKIQFSPSNISAKPLSRSIFVLLGRLYLESFLNVMRNIDVFLQEVFSVFWALSLMIINLTGL